MFSQAGAPRTHQSVHEISRKIGIRRSQYFEVKIIKMDFTKNNKVHGSYVRQAYDSQRETENIIMQN